MYTPIEYIFTLISILNLITAFIIYIINKRQGISINSGKNFKSFRICITMSLMFGMFSMLLLFKNLEIGAGIGDNGNKIDYSSFKNNTTITTSNM
ncbi:uncharacterized protein KGF55_000845 [Candida pseudojiufengensis]|uniref:uncharacterized protein n=1 Tax=Candida pseudojiufengensis TaxID=497109 RepID=UPI00222560C0|nr:uncharacterized protein KGF55_000845 [Candida pseudojiufengensis]KAI5966536.1 hypothetical protein KGF55_000845 [Candida pseudojiufengensis]